MRSIGNSIVVSECGPPAYLYETQHSAHTSEQSASSSSGARSGRTPAPFQPHRRAKVRSHTQAKGKGRLDSDREHTADARIQDGEPTEDNAPVLSEDDAHTPDPLEQELSGSPRMESLGLDERADSPQLEHNNAHSESHSVGHGAEGDRESQLEPDPPVDKVDPQEDNDPVPGLKAQPDDLPGGPNDWNPDDLVPHLDALRNSANFVDRLREASLDNDAIPPDVRERLRSPPTDFPVIDADLRMCIEIFLGTTNGSQDTYDNVCRAIRRRFPDIHMLSYEQMRRKLVDLTGVIPVMTDMCFDSCVAFTGPFSELRACPECSSARYETVTRGNKRISVPHKQALTIPVGPQIQAQYRSREGAWNMGHRVRVMEPLLASLRAGGSIETYDDVYCGSTLINAARRGDLTSDDVVLMLSVDGAQLYQSKQSDCWIYIWVLLDLAPDLRYKKKYVLPGGFIPGPNKPKNLDSFMYTGLHHLAALQRDGLRIWDSLTGRIYTSRPSFS